MTIRFFKGPLDDVLNSDGVQDELERHAKAIVSRARGKRGTSKMTFRTRSGKSRRGAFAQAIMRGEGQSATAVEFGTSRTPAYAPLRSSIRGR